MVVVGGKHNVIKETTLTTGSNLGPTHKNN